MNHDRHIYITTAVLAVVLATAISVLAPRGPFAASAMQGSTVPRDTSTVSRTAEHAIAIPQDAAPAL